MISRKRSLWFLVRGILVCVVMLLTACGTSTTPPQSNGPKQGGEPTHGSGADQPRIIATIAFKERSSKVK